MFNRRNFPADLCQLGALVAGNMPPDVVAEDDWPPLVARACQHGLGPLLWWRLKKRAIDLAVHPVFAPLVEIAHHTAMGAALLDRAHRAVDGALRAAGVPALWLKGAALAHTVYPTPELRPMGDLDVLVPHADRERALAAVRAIGYDFYTTDAHVLGGGRDPLLARLSYHDHLRGGPGGAVLLEIHHRLLSNDDALLTLDQHDWFWSQRQTLTLPDGFQFETLTSEAHLLYLCAHALMQHGGDDAYLLRFHDLHLLIERVDLNWDVIIDQAVVFGWTTAVARALYLTGRYFGTPYPPWVIDDLHDRRPPHEDPTLVARLSAAGGRWQQVRERLRHLTWRERLVFTLRVALPPPAYMRQRYPIRPGRPVWPWYARRWIDQAGAIAAALVETLRQRLSRRGDRA